MIAWFGSFCVFGLLISVVLIAVVLLCLVLGLLLCCFVVLYCLFLSFAC